MSLYSSTATVSGTSYISCTADSQGGGMYIEDAAVLMVDLTAQGNNAKYMSGDGDDIIYGGGGHNYMNAGAGDDLLVAQGTVMDAMRGGSGADTFDITQAQGNVLINDFSFAEGDVLRMGASMVGSAFFTGSLQQGDDAVIDHNGSTITVKDFFAQGNINFNQIELV